MLVLSSDGSWWSGRRNLEGGARADFADKTQQGRIIKLGRSGQRGEAFFFSPHRLVTGLI